jgi:hypothetical protein
MPADHRYFGPMTTALRIDFPSARSLTLFPCLLGPRMQFNACRLDGSWASKKNLTDCLTKIRDSERDRPGVWAERQ